MSKERAERHGRWAEIAAIGWLILTGHRILHRRWKCHYGEIDIIARRRKCLIFIEVKYRKTASATAFPTINQQRRICRAASHFLQSSRLPQESQSRFDLILLQSYPKPAFNFIRQIKHAWSC